MGNDEKKVARKRFDEIMGVAKRHHLAKLLNYYIIIFSKYII